VSWIEQGHGLVREFKTPDFMASYRLASAVVGPAESLGHHPEICFGWGFVRITLTTHDAGGITELDHRLAEAIDRAIKPFDLYQS
jgi:4a-hydroxytetrahydrobiopterin dehydratase